MANYQLSPAPTFGIGEHPFTTWRNGFTDDEINKIIEIGDSLPKQKARVGADFGEEALLEIRDSDVAWIPQQEDTTWIYDRLGWILRQINGEFYKFDIYGFVEDLQYTIYEEANEGHYTWHRDTGTGTGGPPRKLSMVVQLTDPAEYEGGELELWTAANPEQLDKEKGLVAVFPGYVLHRVAPVTKGIRRSLVIWSCGPAFR